MTVEVTQAVSRNDADEIAVGPFMDRYLDGSSFSDDRRELTQAFARHRLAAVRDLEAERVKLWNEKRDLEGSLIVQKAATDELKAQLAEARRVIKAWADWQQLVEDDPKDDLPYLNGPAWDDAEVLGEKARAFLSRTGGEA